MSPLVKLRLFALLALSALLASCGTTDSASGNASLAEQENHEASVPTVADLDAAELAALSEHAYILYGFRGVPAALIYHGVKKYPTDPTLLRLLADIYVEDVPHMAAVVFAYIEDQPISMSQEERERLDVSFASAMWIWGLSRRKDGEPMSRLGDFFSPELYEYDMEAFRAQLVQPMINEAGSLEAAKAGAHRLLGALVQFEKHQSENLSYELVLRDPDGFYVSKDYRQWLEENPRKIYSQLYEQIKDSS